MKRWAIDASKRLVVLCPGARSHIKRWDGGRFAQVADRLIAEHGVEVVFSGEPDEGELINEIRAQMTHRAHTAVGSTTLTQTAVLMQRSALVLTNDSASLHLACAVGAPVLALFGPTDEHKYGPTGSRDRVLRRRLVCAPCEQALCRFHHECMRFLSAEEVYVTASQLLNGVR
jgi:lipopolysaccharide heptosyltransferase II